jgi:N-acetylated-alpha-linked acidic dipeptidase
LSAKWQSVDRDMERRLLEAVSVEEAWALVETFSTLVRVSGSEQEREAANYVLGRLQSWQVPHQLYEPELYLSVPVSAQVEVMAPDQFVFHAKTPAFSVSTGQAGLSGEVVYIPRAASPDMSSLYSPSFEIGDRDLHGKIVLTDGMSGPDEVQFFSQRGSIGQIFVNPGERIHWSICTSIWGTPDLDTFGNKPTVAVADVNRRDGEQLIRLAEQGGLQITIRTELKEGWFRCPLIVAEVPGNLEPSKFVLVHGHLDSWDVGVGDNATGDAALLELARLFWTHRRDLKRSVRFAWWPGHSTGRYAGSTWYADHFGLDLADNCIAHLNIDSPGCRWADRYEHVCWMTEMEGFCKQVIRDVTGQEAQGERPYRAGDYTFNNIGLSGFFMLLSEMPTEKRQELGYYAVGGCGGNIGWHTEDDRLEIADKQNLERDIKVYAIAIARILNSPIYPFDFIRLVQEYESTLSAYQNAGSGCFDLGPALREAAALKADMERFYARLEGVAASSPLDQEIQHINATLLELARVLVANNFSRAGTFRQDPAISIDPLPDLAFIKEISTWPSGSDTYRFGQTQLTRGQNRVLGALKRARKLAE